MRVAATVGTALAIVIGASACGQSAHSGPDKEQTLRGYLQGTLSKTHYAAITDVSFSGDVVTITTMEKHADYLCPATMGWKHFQDSPGPSDLVVLAVQAKTFKRICHKGV